MLHYELFKNKSLQLQINSLLISSRLVTFSKQIIMCLVYRMQ